RGDRARAVALGTAPRRGAGLAAGAVAAATGGVGGESEGDGDAVDRLDEPDRRLGLDVGTASRGLLRAAATAAEEAAEQVAETAAGLVAEQVVDVEATAGPAPAAATEAAGESAEAPGDAAHLVVLLAALGVADDVVGLGDLLEPLVLGSVAGVGVGVVLPGELAIGLLDLVGAGVLLHAERLVEVLARPVGVGHPTPPLMPVQNGKATRRQLNYTSRSGMAL